MYFTKFGKFLVIISLNVFLAPYAFSSHSGTNDTNITFIIVPQDPEALFIFFPNLSSVFQVE